MKKPHRLMETFKALQEPLNCDEAFSSISTYKNGDICLRVKVNNYLVKTDAEKHVLFQLAEINKITMGDWVWMPDKYSPDIWRMTANEFIYKWLISKFPSYKERITKELHYAQCV